MEQYIDFRQLHALMEMCLTWIGFGTVCGLAAKAVLPGRDPGGAFVTFLLGIGGALIGSAIYTLASGSRIRDLISLSGFAVAIGGALVLLISHRLLSGRMYNLRGPMVEEIIVPQPQYSRRRRRTIRGTDLD